MTMTVDNNIMTVFWKCWHIVSVFTLVDGSPELASVVTPMPLPMSILKSMWLAPLATLLAQANTCLAVARFAGCNWIDWRSPTERAGGLSLALARHLPLGRGTHYCRQQTGGNWAPNEELYDKTRTSHTPTVYVNTGCYILNTIYSSTINTYAMWYMLYAIQVCILYTVFCTGDLLRKAMGSAYYNYGIRLKWDIKGTGGNKVSYNCMGRESISSVLFTDLAGGGPSRTKPNRTRWNIGIFSNYTGSTLSPSSGRARGLRFVRFSHNFVLPEYMTATNFMYIL